MERKIRVGAVSYLNTKPLIYGFEQGLMTDKVELLNDYPSNIAARLLSNEIDIGLVPVAVIPSLPEHHIISDYCIGCFGEVASVCLFSDVPLAEIEIILLDYQSKTSVALLRTILRTYWKISPRLVMAKSGYEREIGGRTAGLVIGDRAFEQRLVSTHHFDLGLAWKEMTGLPFVFAAWVSNKELPAGFEESFNAANELGLNNISKVVSENPCAVFDLAKYYSSFISYQLDDDKMKGLDLFLSMLP